MGIGVAVAFTGLNVAGYCLMLVLTSPTGTVPKAVEVTFAVACLAIPVGLLVAVWTEAACIAL